MTMTMTKNLGELGFKDLEVFNIALLAKQSWRLMIEPKALWAKIQRGVYFHDKDFIKAKKGGHAL